MKNKIALIYLSVDGALIALSMYMGGAWLLNTQVAFICSMLVVFASFYSYKGMIAKKLENMEISQERDLLDKIDDKHELFEEEEAQDLMSEEEFKEFYKEERAKLSGTKKSFSNLFKSWSGALGIFRLLAYVVLFISVLVLIKNEFFEPIAFIFGISALPLATVILSSLEKN